MCDGCAGRRGPVVVSLYFRGPGLLELCRKCFGRRRLNAGLLIGMRKLGIIPVPVTVDSVRDVWRGTGWAVEDAMREARDAIKKESGELWARWK